MKSKLTIIVESESHSRLTTIIESESHRMKIIPITELRRVKKLFSRIFPRDKTGIIYKFNLVIEKSTPIKLRYNIERHLEQSKTCNIIGSVNVSTIDDTEYQNILYVTKKYLEYQNILYVTKKYLEYQNILYVTKKYLRKYPSDARHIIVESSFNKLSLDGKSDKVVEVLQQQLSLDVQSVRDIISHKILKCAFTYKPRKSENDITIIIHPHKNGKLALSYPTARLKEKLGALEMQQRIQSKKENLQALEGLKERLQRSKQSIDKQIRELQKELQHLRNLENEKLQSTLTLITEVQRIKKLLSETCFGDQEQIYKLHLAIEKRTPTELIYNIERRLQHKIDTIGSVSISTIDSITYRRILHVTGIIAGGHLGHYPLEKEHIIVKSSFNKLSLDGKSDEVVKVLRQQLSLDVQFVRLISGHILGCDWVHNPYNSENILGCDWVHNPYNSENCITTIKSIKYHHIEGNIVALSYLTAKLKQESKEQPQHLKEVEKEAITNINPKGYQSMVRMQQSLKDTIKEPKNLR